VRHQERKMDHWKEKTIEVFSYTTAKANERVEGTLWFNFWSRGLSV
jgi:hypothetical protein